MLLTIDSGNTNVVFAVYDSDRQRASWRCGNYPKRTADEYAVWLTQLFEIEGLMTGDIDGAIVGSVVPETKGNLVEALPPAFLEGRQCLSMTRLLILVSQ